MENNIDLFSPEKPNHEIPEFSVSEISNRLKQVIEGNFSYVKIRGEFSKITIAKSGHLYTSLKDDKSVIDAICWKGTLSHLSIKPEEGIEVICTGRITTYPGRSNYQLIIEKAEIAGEGALLKMLEERKRKLEEEGLFATERKKKIPFIPETICVITSPTGAVIRDIMHRLNERFPRRVLLYPVMVQGAGAAEQITDALKKINGLTESSPYRPDVIIIARGGGSLEDLMPFNDEALVRAVASSSIPIISAVGHETDTTLIDYTADLRAPTPTAAAEKAVPVRTELIALIASKQISLISSINRLIKHRNTVLQGLARGIKHPKSQIENYIQKLGYLSIRLETGLYTWLDKKLYRLKESSSVLNLNHIKKSVKDNLGKLDDYCIRLTFTRDKIIENRLQKLLNTESLLNSYSFKKVLDRGYSAVFTLDGSIISSKSHTKSGQNLKIRFKDGEIQVKSE